MAWPATPTRAAIRTFSHFGISATENAGPRNLGLHQGLALIIGIIKTYSRQTPEVQTSEVAELIFRLCCENDATEVKACAVRPAPFQEHEAWSAFATAEVVNTLTPLGECHDR
jgi:hypothetical protein